MKKSYNISREILVDIVVSLSRAECWLMEMSKKHPEHGYIYSANLADTLRLEMDLRDMIDFDPLEVLEK